jgi:alanine racemase
MRLWASLPGGACVARARLTIDLDAIAANWRALKAQVGPLAETAVVVKADAYGLGAAAVAPALARAGARSFFVAIAEEGAAIRPLIGPDAEIFVLSGYMRGDRAAVEASDLVPVLAGPEDFRRFRAELAGRPAAVQVDTGLNRLGFEPVELAAHLLELNALRPRLVMSHLACADEPSHPMNGLQLAAFHALTLGLPGIRRSLAATGGAMLGPFYAFDMVRAGIGLYGGLPFAGARPVVTLALPVLQVRDVLPGEAVGYGASFVAQRPMRIATVSAGYADGVLRAFAGKGTLMAGRTPCPLVGRVSMDLVTVDVTGLPEVPEALDLLGPGQGPDAVAAMAGTIGYEILTSLGTRYVRDYKGAVA